MLGVRDAYLNLALWTRAMAAITRLLDRGTQCMSLSAATEHSKCRQGLPGPHAHLLRLAVVHKAQTAVAAISGQRRARWHAFSQRRVRDARVRPNFFNHM